MLTQRRSRSSITGQTAPPSSLARTQSVLRRSRIGGGFCGHASGKHQGCPRAWTRSWMGGSPTLLSRHRPGNGWGWRKRQILEARARSQRLANLRFFPYQPKESLRDSFASADMFVVSLKRGLAGYIVPSKLYGILAADGHTRSSGGGVRGRGHYPTVQCGLVVEPGDAKAWPQEDLTLVSRSRAMAATPRS